MKRRTAIILLGICLLAVIASLVWPREREPEYQGRKLSEWTAICKNKGIGQEMHEQAEAAVRSIGAEGVPWALRRLAIERPTWRDRWRDAIRKIPIPIAANTMSYLVALGERNNDSYADALTYFNVTGSAARPAIPQLTRMMEDPSSTVNLRARAIYALALIGKDAGPDLARALTNEVQLDRETVAWGIGYIRNLGTDSTTVVQALVQSLRDQNPLIAKQSAQALGGLATGKDLAIPALVASLQDSRIPVQKAAIIALGMFREKAEAAIPQLEQMIGNPNLAKNLRQDAIYALGLIGKEAVPPLLSASTNQAQLDRGDVLLSLASIQDLGTNTVTIVRVLIQSLTDPDVSVASISARTLGKLRAEPDIAVPALVQSLKDSRDPVRGEAVIALAGFRGAAKEAVRDLRLMLNDPNEYIRVWVTNALEAISQQGVQSGDYRTDATGGSRK